MAKAKPKVNCTRCNDDGLYTILPRGNPFLMDIFSLARRLEVRTCHCATGRALTLYGEMEAAKASVPATPN